MITKTNAKKMYKLTDVDLDYLECHKRRSPYHACVTYYFLKDVRLIAIDKKFGINYPSSHKYEKCVKKILDEVEIENNNKLSRYDKRRMKLEAELDKYGLKIRADSYYCNQYLHYCKFTLKQVVNMMVTMDFFVNKTVYNGLLTEMMNEEDGRITESCKEYAKIESLKQYLENHSKKHVPQVVLDEYLRR